MVSILSLQSAQGQDTLRSIINRFNAAEAGSCDEAVRAIIETVRREGQAALLSYCRRFDCPNMEWENIRVSKNEFREAQGLVDDSFRQTLAFAIERIRSFHERSLDTSWMLTRSDGLITGRLAQAVDAAGLYVPGGRQGATPLVSSVLMNGIPAQIAGTPRRVMMTPPNKQGRVHPTLLVAAAAIGIEEVYKLGSAWAIAALAYGAGDIAPVDVIAGPGNQYVAEAKRQVMGQVRIDMLAGPSEVLIVADASANPAFIAADMLAQAEHDPQALALAIVLEPGMANAVRDELARQVRTLTRAEIAQQALAARGCIFIADKLEQALDYANQIAIEHLELHLAEPWRWLPRIRHAGAIFLGHYTPEAAGDYVAGPNHVLPTLGTARIASSLGVETFLKYSSIISYSPEALQADQPHICLLSALEGLDAHGRSVTLRLNGE